MKSLLLAAALAVIALSQPARSAAPYEACSDMTNKLAVIYDFRGYPKAASGKADLVGASEEVVRNAYGTTKSALDKKWRGFFDWSALAVLEGLHGHQTPSEFRSSSMLKCMAKYG